MSKIKLTGDSSGYVEISAPSAAGNNTLELPSSGSKIVVADASDNVNVAGILTSVGGLNVGTGGTIITTTAGGDINIDSGGVYYDASNNRFGIGTTTVNADLHTYNSSGDSEVRITSNSSNEAILRFGNTVDQTLGSIRFESPTDSLVFYGNNDTERMRIASNGHISCNFAGSAQFSVRENTSAAAVYFADSTQAQGTGWYLFYGVSDSNTVVQAWIRGDGTYGSRANVYGSTSDIKLKENIQNASSQWSDIKSIEIKNFNLIGDAQRQIGVIAQQVETVSPGLVDETPDRDKYGNETGEVTKSVKYSVLYMKAVKALQEAMERIEQLETEMAAVKAQLS